MSISMEQFAANGHFVTFDPHAQSISRVSVFQLQCTSCGFEPEDVVVAPKICPKCRGRAWERFTKPGGILENADRYVA